MRSFSTGFLAGIFVTVLAYVILLPGEDAGTATTQEAAAPATPGSDQPSFEFFTELPKQRIEIDVDPEEIQAHRGANSSDVYILQAGSFRDAEDADRRRAELLLLGLEPKVEETNGDNGRWFRVYLGPFDSRSRMQQARSLTAQQDIDTLLLKRSRP
jgi:cell division protein FtsN